MKTFIEWMGGIEVNTLGQDAKNTAYQLTSKLKEVPGSTYQIIYTVPHTPIQFGKPVGDPGEHTYSYNIDFTTEGKWVIKSKNRYHGNDHDAHDGPWFDLKNAISAINGAVASAYMHGGKIWFSENNGPKQLVKDSSNPMKLNNGKFDTTI